MIYGPVSLAGRMGNGMESDRDLSCSAASSRAWSRRGGDEELQSLRICLSPGDI